MCTMLQDDPNIINHTHEIQIATDLHNNALNLVAQNFRC